MSNKIYLQITSGRGSAECCRIVALKLHRILRQAQELNLEAEVVEREEGELNRTLFSAIVSLERGNPVKVINELLN